ncbi:MAG TPA: hypothetical protein VFN37_04685 [Candidatus Baltobacteraceae bacterium]|nr:hypothetical protein [Candidatus Baltobacteraceae bacterium]
MEKQPDDKHGLFEDDELDTAIANVDDTGMVRSQQQILEGEELRHMPQEDEEEQTP